MARLGELTNDSSFDDVAEAIILETVARGYSREESVACVSTGIQESGLRMVWSDNHEWFGYYQQNSGYADRMDPNGNIRGFLDRLDVKRRSSGASKSDPFLNIFWLQQRPSDPSADTAYARGRKAYLTEIKQHVAQASALYDRFAGGAGGGAVTPEPGFSGDPWWLADVLRAEGLNVFEVDGWQDRGQGAQGVLWGAVFHHTGSPNETPNGIAFHPDLGLAAHLLIRPNGDVWVCGIGKANHAGKGSWWGIPTDNANPVTIGVEVAILPREGAPHREGWPDVQYDATVKTMAALMRKLGQGSDHVISHKEWAQLGPAGWRQGKWDPGAIDMDIFRGDVQARIESFNPGGGEEDWLNMPSAIEMLTRIHDEVTKGFPSRSIYRNPGEGLVDTGFGMLLNVDAMAHQELVERLALKYHDDDAILRIVRVADEQGADPDDEWAVEHAKSVLAQLPEEVLVAWNEKRKAA